MEIFEGPSCGLVGALDEQVGLVEVLLAGHTCPRVGEAVRRPFGSRPTTAPLSDPTDVPMARSGVRRRSASAWSMPTWIAPRLPPPPRTKAQRAVNLRIRVPNYRQLASCLADDPWGGARLSTVPAWALPAGK